MPVRSFARRAPPLWEADWDDAPRYARFLDQTGEHYLVEDLPNGEPIRVDKARSIPDPFPAHAQQPVPGSDLLRWSAFALGLSLLGGMGGIAVGSLTLALGIMRRIHLSVRLRRWQRRYPDAPLPAAARGEYERLRATTWQSVLAVVLGSLVGGLLILRFR